MIRGRIPHAEIALAGTGAALGFWLTQPSLSWAAAAFALGAGAALLAARAQRSGLALFALFGLMGAVTAGATSARVSRVQRHWSDVREELILNASRRLGTTLEESVALARALADRGVAVAGDSQPVAFRRLEQAVPAGPESGVVVLDPDGRPWAWAGRHRLLPAPGGGELDARMTAFYVVLEARRQIGNRVAIGQVLIAADSAVPDGSRAVAARFTRATGAALQFYRPGGAPLRTDVFDYCLPSCTAAAGAAAPDTLFSIRTLPPAQGTYQLSLLDAAGRTVTFATLLCLVGLLVLGEYRSRYAALLLAGALLLFTPAGARAGLRSLFSPATYYWGPLDPLTSSAGALLVTAAILVAAVAALRTAVRTNAVTSVAAAVLALVSPLAASALSQGITPLPNGVGINLWLGWEVALALAISGMLLMVATLAPALRAGLRWAGSSAVAWSVLVAIAGILLWQPDRGWPPWYGLLWLPSIGLLVLSGGRIRQVLATGLVAGCAAALLTWGAAVRGRIALAQADARRVGGEQDQVAVALLERIGDDPSRSGLHTSADLYRLWHRSPLSSEGYPASLAVWNARGQPVAELRLADVDLTNRLLQALGSSAAGQRAQVVEILSRTPGTYAVLARPLPDSTVLTVGIGPRSRLIPRARIARLLDNQPVLPPPYDMTLSETAEGHLAETRLTWRREGQTLHGDQLLQLPNGSRVLHVSLETGEMPGLLVRGALALLVDAAVLLVLWLFAEALRGRAGLLPQLLLFSRLKSYRLRIALALAVFFIVPTVGFATWMAGRIRYDARRSDDLVIRQSLRDASALEEGRAPASDPPPMLPARSGGELFRYRAGTFQSGTTPVLGELGLVDAYLPPEVFRDVIADQGGETAADMMMAGRPVRAGFVSMGAARDVVLAMPLLADERQPVSGEGDLGYALLLVTVVGLFAAGKLAGVAARSLAEPVGRLRVAAEAVGRGETPPPLGQVPEEFTPVAEAFTRMARDVQASRGALEAARSRTVAVLRNVATGVIALDANLGVILANPRAEELLERQLDPGVSVAGNATNDWPGVWEWVKRFLASGEDVAGEEFTVRGRRMRVRASTLGRESGCVVALDDVTELTHAVRVLAWGEIARQVAHEIKNPLTPMRLGVQHLLRVKGDSRESFEQALERTSRQILAEIDRLDRVARAFARFGAPPAEEEPGPLAVVDLVAVARETAALYALGGEGEVRLLTDGVIRGLSRPDELREVLVNLVENARNAKASRVDLSVEQGGNGRVRIQVTDNGRGVRPEDLPRIFEPHFSTTTSGTGLGLAISKRLVGSWGGTIEAASRVGLGTTVTIDLPSAG